jgi:hypothetical protein
LAGHTNYFWRASANNPAGTSDWSTTWSFTTVATTSISNHVGTPNEYRLCQNYPNPFNPSTTIRYELKEAGRASLKVFDLLGQEVATLVDGEKAAGLHSVEFEAGRLASGLYFYTLRTNSNAMTLTMMLLK